jgi:hypothetical protein
MRGVIVALAIAVAAVICAVMVAPSIDQDIRVQASIVVVSTAAMFALIAWAMTPP